MTVLGEVLPRNSGAGDRELCIEAAALGAAAKSVKFRQQQSLPRFDPLLRLRSGILGQRFSRRSQDLINKHFVGWIRTCPKRCIRGIDFCPEDHGLTGGTGHFCPRIMGRAQKGGRKAALKPSQADAGSDRPSRGGRSAKTLNLALSAPPRLDSKIAVIGIDIGKNWFHVVGQDERGAMVLRQKWSRGQVEARFANMPPCLVGMEACVGAHHLSRRLKALGHDARLMPAKYVRPYPHTRSSHTPEFARRYFAELVPCIGHGDP